MDITTKNRAELKSYFVKNSIPTERNFAELIDGMLNQKDDGFVKLPGNPLSIEAAGDNASEKKALHIYQNFGDPNPAWTLSLNPRASASDPKTAKLGFNIGDGEGKSRLFIDRSTGNLGVGTTDPKSPLSVSGGVAIGAGYAKTNAAAANGLIVEGSVGIGTPTTGAKLDVAGTIRADDIALARANDARGGLFLALPGDFNHALYNNNSNRDKEGAWDGAKWNVFQGLSIRVGSGTAKVSALYINASGNVGVGATNPAAKLTIQTPADYEGDTLRIESKQESGNYFLNLAPVTTGGVVRWVFNQRNNQNSYSAVLAFDRGNIGIGTTDPAAKLDVNGTIWSREGFKFPDASVQTTAMRIVAGRADFGRFQNVQTLSQMIDIKGFNTAPTVIVSLATIDADQARNLRIDASATEITANSFKLNVASWADTIIYSAKVSWIAFGR
jgi:hypothetical protein